VVSIREKAKKYKEDTSETNNEKISDDIKEVIDEVTREKDKVKPFDMPQVKEKSKILSLEQKYLDNIPEWTRKPWMYITPVHDGQLSKWLEDWKDLILDYCRTLVKHVLSVSELQTVKPFANSDINKKLSQEQLIKIFDIMQEKGLARWLDDNKIRVHVYYKTIEEWAELMYNYLMKTGKAAEILTLFELQHMKQEWSSLPLESIRELISVLINRNQAKYVTKERDAISLIY
jgi:ESCRT-II complex subunit VPS25